MLQSLVYVSSATEAFSAEELAELLRISQRNNAAIGVTGLLLHVGGNFMQALEGEEAEVERLYEKISRDPRHRLVRVIMRWPVAERAFPAWAMGFKEARSLPPATRAEISSFLDDSLKETATADGLSGDQTALRLLRTFAATMR